MELLILSKKNYFEDKAEKLNKKVTSNKTKHIEIKTKLENL